MPTFESSVTQISDLVSTIPADTDSGAYGAHNIRNVKTAVKTLNDSGGSAQVGFLQSGTGATSRTVQAKLREVVSLEDFGAVGDGVTDDTAAINAALAAVASSGKRVFAPQGTYLYGGGGLLGAGVVIEGEGRNSTIFKSRLASPTGGYLINCSGYGSGVAGVRFIANVAQTAGSYVCLSGAESFIDDFFMDGDFNGVLMTGNVARIRHGRFQNGATGAIRIRAEGGDNSQSIDDVLMGAQSPQVSAAGIRVRNSSALTISNTSVIQQGYNLLIDPTTNTTSSNTADGSVFALYVHDSFFDNASGNAVRVAATGTANVARIRLANCWLGSSALDGLFVSNSGSGIVQGVELDSCHVVLNGSSGITTSGTVSGIKVIGGGYAQNNYGMFFNQGATGITVVGAEVGAYEGQSGNTNVGIVLNHSSIDDIVIVGNRMIGNGGSAITDNSTGTKKVIWGNTGDTITTDVTWTPVLTCATPGDLAVTASATGKYTRIGNQITASYQIVTSSFTWTTASGEIRITGLPFTAINDFARMGVVWFGGITKAGYTQVNCAVEPGQSYIKLRASGSGQNAANLSISDMPSGGTVTLRGEVTFSV